MSLCVSLCECLCVCVCVKLSIKNFEFRAEYKEIESLSTFVYAEFKEIEKVWKRGGCRRR